MDKNSFSIFETKDRIIKEDPKSSYFIKPFLAGREIKRYETPKEEKYLILIPKGFTIKRNLPEDDPNYLPEVNEPPRYGYMEKDTAWNWFKRNLPAIAKHLEPFQKAAEKRFDKGDFWWELRACDYYNEFEQEKIIYPNICKRPEFTFDDNKKYTNQKCFVITKFDLGFLGILNSSLTYFLFDSILPKLRGDFYEPSYVYLKDFPIMNDESGKIEKLVTEIFESKKANQYFDPSTLEKEIDKLVYELYELTEEEIRIVEGGEG